MQSIREDHFLLLHIQPLIAPRLHIVKNGQKALSQLCQSVFHPRGNLAKIMTQNKPVRLEFSELLRQGTLYPAIIGQTGQVLCRPLPLAAHKLSVGGSHHALHRNDLAAAL